MSFVDDHVIIFACSLTGYIWCGFWAWTPFLTKRVLGCSGYQGLGDNCCGRFFSCKLSCVEILWYLVYGFMLIATSPVGVTLFLLYLLFAAISKCFILCCKDECSEPANTPWSVSLCLWFSCFGSLTLWRCCSWFRCCSACCRCCDSCVKRRPCCCNRPCHSEENGCCCCLKGGEDEVILVPPPDHNPKKDEPVFVIDIEGLTPEEQEAKKQEMEKKRLEEQKKREAEEKKKKEQEKKKQEDKKKADEKRKADEKKKKEEEIKKKQKGLKPGHIPVTNIHARYKHVTF